MPQKIRQEDEKEVGGGGGGDLGKGGQPRPRAEGDIWLPSKMGEQCVSRQADSLEDCRGQRGCSQAHVGIGREPCDRARGVGVGEAGRADAHRQADCQALGHGDLDTCRDMWD